MAGTRLLELTLRHVPPPGPVTLHADDPDPTVLGPEAVEFGRLNLPGLAHLGGPEGQECQGGVMTRNAGPDRGSGPRTPPGRSASTVAGTSIRTPSNGCPPGPGDPSPGRFRTYQANPCSVCHLHRSSRSSIANRPGLVSAQDPPTGQRHNLIEGRPGWPATSPGAGAAGRGPRPVHTSEGLFDADRSGPRTAATGTPGWS